MNEQMFAVLASLPLIPLGYFLDLSLARHNSDIYLRFLAWWLWLSDANITSWIKKASNFTGRLEMSLFGKTLLSIKSTLVSVLLLTILSVVYFSWLSRNSDEVAWKNAIGVLIVSGPILLPGIVIIFILRVLLRYGNAQPTLPRILFCGAICTVAVQIVFMLLAYLFGRCASFWTYFAFTHNVTEDDNLTILWGGYAIYTLGCGIYGNILLLPVIAFGSAFCLSLIIYVVSVVLHVCEEFFRIQIEANQRKPFTSIATFLVMACLLFQFMFSYLLIASSAILKAQNKLTFASAKYGWDHGDEITFPDQASRQGYAIYRLKSDIDLVSVALVVGPTPLMIKNFEKTMKRIIKDAAVREK